MRITIIRLLYKIADPIRRFYWFVVRPTQKGVKCLIEHDGKFLFVRNSYGSKKWTFPGGGVKRRESPESAAARETQEEVGINLLGKLINLGTYVHEKEYKHDHITIFYTKIQNSEFIIDPGEIEEARWMSFDELPKSQGSTITATVTLFNGWKNKQ